MELELKIPVLVSLLSDAFSGYNFSNIGFETRLKHERTFVSLFVCLCIMLFFVVRCHLPF